jgi:hypothetical protein
LWTSEEATGRGLSVDVVVVGRAKRDGRECLVSQLVLRLF